MAITVTIPQNSSDTIDIISELVLGAPQDVVLSIPNLMPGLQARFSPPTLTSGAIGFLTLTVHDVAPGTYTMYVVATGPVSTSKDLLTLIVTPSEFSISTGRD